MRIVLDANVIIAALIARGICTELLSAVVSKHHLLLSEQLLSEVSQTLTKKGKIPAKLVKEALDPLMQVAEILEPGLVSSRACRDPNDLHVLGLALAGQAEIIVTGDQDLLVLKKFKRTKIVAVRQCWEMLRG